MATTLWTCNTPANVSAGQGGFSFRNIYSGLSAGNLGQVRVTLVANVITLKLTHVSIGVVGAATPPNCTNIQTLLWGGNAAVTVGDGITPDVTATSDWLTVPAFTSADSLLIDQDCDPAGTGDMNTGVVVGGGAGNAANDFFSGAGANPPGDYNNINVVGYSSNPNINRSVILIETQSGAAPVTLMGAICT